MRVLFTTRLLQTGPEVERGFDYSEVIIGSRFTLFKLSSSSPFVYFSLLLRLFVLRLFVSPFVCFFCLFVFLLFCFVCFFIYLHVYLFVYLVVCLFIYSMPCQTIASSITS